MVHEPKKQFYKRFLYEPFPVESSLREQVRRLCLACVARVSTTRVACQTGAYARVCVPPQVADHFNAEVVAGTIRSRQASGSERALGRRGASPSKAYSCLRPQQGCFESLCC
jgi:hypothetical protein